MKLLSLPQPAASLLASVRELVSREWYTWFRGVQEHDHATGNGAQVDHASLASKGTNTHAQVDAFVASKAAANGLASLDASQKVAQDPASATATPTASKIPIADGAGKLAEGWIPDLPSGQKIGDTVVASWSIEVNANGTGSRYAYVDFHGDDTYTDYGLRIIRDNTGVNANSQMVHRGTGNLGLVVVDAGTMTFATNNTERLRITSDGKVEVPGVGHFYPSGTTPDNSYNGTIRSTKPVASGQHINLTRVGSYVWSIGFVYNTNTFAIGAGTATDSSFTSPAFQIDQYGKVGIGGTPGTSCALDIQSAAGALMLPRMTTTQRDALTAANGMLIYNTTLNKFQGCENGAWVNLI